MIVPDWLSQSLARSHPGLLIRKERKEARVVLEPVVISSRYRLRITDAPFMKGRNASGMRIDPSAC